MSEGMKVTRTTEEEKPQEDRGASVNLSTGDAQIPSGSGTEQKNLHGQDVIGIPKQQFIDLCESVGEYRLAAEARGQKYNPSLLRRGYEQLNKPVSLGKVAIIAVATVTTVWVFEKGWDLLSKKFGWGIYKNQTPEQQSSIPTPENGMDNNVPRSRRQPPAMIAQA